MNPFFLALRWYKKHGRDLPWRKTRKPYHILVSEIMLQQTQVDRGILYFDRWLKRFPSWRSLARAPKSEVLKAWSGLGYNRRALYLKSVAEHVVTHGLPQTEQEWGSLKGVGEYTAAAISIFSQNRRVIPIDTNIRRILGRVFFGKPFSTPKDDGRIRQEAERKLRKIGEYRDVPQALFDIANLYCKKTPLCEVCPLKRTCKAAPKFLSGKVRIPKRSIKKPLEHVREGKTFPDRIYRGRILRVVKDQGALPKSEIGPLIDPVYRKQDEAWVTAMIERLIKDGLIVRRKGGLVLPE